MSSEQLPNTISPVLLAEEIDCAFQCIADVLPAEAKQAPLHVPYSVIALKGIGELYSIYGGVERYAAPLADRRFISLAVTTPWSGTLAFLKRYELQYSRLHSANQLLHDLEPTDPEDLEHGPELLCALKALHKTLIKPAIVAKVY